MTSRNGEILTVQDVAKELRISPNKTYQMFRDQTIPAWKVDGLWRMTRRQLEDWVDEQSTERAG